MTFLVKCGIVLCRYLKSNTLFYDGLSRVMGALGENPRYIFIRLWSPGEPEGHSFYISSSELLVISSGIIWKIKPVRIAENLRSLLMFYYYGVRYASVS